LLYVTSRRRYSFFIDAEHAEGLKAVKERDGVPESVQIRRALAEWLEKRGALKTGGKRKKKG
jgi:hypothetical protein